MTLCNAIPMQAGDLSTTYMSSGDFRVMGSLLMHDMEIKMCETVQNGLYDFLMSSKTNMRRTLQTRKLSGGELEISPFILARQYSPINNVYWEFTNGHSSGANWVIDVFSATNIPARAESFPGRSNGNAGPGGTNGSGGLRVYLDGKSAGGSSTKTAWEVVSSVLAVDGSHVTLTLASQNTNSKLAADKLGSPTKGILRRGTPNVADFEKFCNEAPTYLNWHDVPFWTETIRNSLCRSAQYDRWQQLVLEDNLLYKELFYLSDIEKNRQIEQDWERRVVDTFFWGKALPNQDINSYNGLDSIEAYDPTQDGLTDVTGVDYGTCVGKRANLIGVYEQLAECNRVMDLQGGQLNLPAMFQSIYNMMRVRVSKGHPNPTEFDIFTDSVSAEMFNQAMLKYYSGKSDGMAQLNVPVDGNMSKTKKAAFGFNYRSFPLFWPAGVTVNILTHFYFDDWLTAANNVGMEDTARVMWILDFTGIYPGIIATNRVIGKTGDLKTLAAINPSFACVMRVNTQEQTLISQTWTAIVDCPMGNLIIENFSGQPFEPLILVGNYDQGGLGGGVTTTTTTTPS